MAPIGEPHDHRGFRGAHLEDSERTSRAPSEASGGEAPAAPSPQIHLQVYYAARGSRPVIPNNPRRKNKHPFDKVAYRQRYVVGRTFARLKDWRRINQLRQLARNYLAAVTLASIFCYWI